MNQKQALSQARKILGPKATVSIRKWKEPNYKNGNPRPTRAIGKVVMGLFNDIQAEGFTWKEAIDNLKEKQHA